MKATHIIERTFTQIFPLWVSKFIGVIYGFLVAPKKSYSQYGEDLILLNFFQKIGIHRGTYVDIGAFHPRWLSNTHLLSQRGWKGVVVDIDEYKTSLFSKARKDCRPITGAVTSANNQGTIKAYFFRRFFSEIDTLSEIEAIKMQTKTGIKFDERLVKTFTINSILENALSSYGQIDFINIDIEGLDEIILSEIDFTRFKIKAICFENNDFFGGSKKIQELLRSENYTHLFTSMGSHCYCLKDSALDSL
jgi:hypothetical protein